VAFVDGVDDHLDSLVGRCDLMSDLGALITRRVIDDKDTHVAARLVIENARDAFREETTVVITRDNNVDHAHWMLSGSSA
jgi:hypothetical protein